MTLRLAGLALALLVASTGLLPCLCAGMASAEAAATHCGSAEPEGPGLTDRGHGCDCACLEAAAPRAQASRAEPPPSGGLAPQPAAVSLAHDAALPAFAPRPAPETSPPTPRLVLRV